MRFVRGKHFDWIEPAAVRGLNEKLPRPRHRMSLVETLAWAAVVIVIALAILGMWLGLQEDPGLSPVEAAVCMIGVLIIGWGIYVLVYRTRIVVTRKAIYRFERCIRPTTWRWDLPSIKRCDIIRCRLADGEYTGILLRLHDGDLELVGVHPDVAVDDLAAFLGQQGVPVVRRDAPAEAMRPEALSEWIAREGEGT